MGRLPRGNNKCSLSRDSENWCMHLCLHLFVFGVDDIKVQFINYTLLSVLRWTLTIIRHSYWSYHLSSFRHERHNRRFASDCEKFRFFSALTFHRARSSERDLYLTNSWDKEVLRKNGKSQHPIIIICSISKNIRSGNVKQKTTKSVQLSGVNSEICQPDQMPESLIYKGHLHMHTLTSRKLHAIHTGTKKQSYAFTPHTSICPNKRRKSLLSLEPLPLSRWNLIPNTADRRQ